MKEPDGNDLEWMAKLTVYLTTRKQREKTIRVPKIYQHRRLEDPNHSRASMGRTPT